MKREVRIENWEKVTIKGSTSEYTCLRGQAHGHVNFGNGTIVQTSRIIDESVPGRVETLNTIYILGKPYDGGTYMKPKDEFDEEDSVLETIATVAAVEVGAIIIGDIFGGGNSDSGSGSGNTDSWSGGGGGGDSSGGGASSEW